MKKLKLILLSFFLVFLFTYTSCREWFSEGGQHIPVTGIDDVKPAKIEVISPQYGSTWKPGDILTIRWVTNIPINKVNIELYRKSAFQFVIVREKDNDGVFNWDIPESINHSVHYKIKISNQYRPSEYAVTESFAIMD
jgi:hypothetical protein